MKFYTKFFLLILILHITNIPDFLIAEENHSGSDDTILSIRQSLIPLFVEIDYFKNNPFYSQRFPMRKINPQSKKYIYYYLQQEPLKTSNALWLLGFLGNTQDLSEVDTYIQSALKQKTTYATSRELEILSQGAGAFAGIMIKRNVSGAKDFFDKYAQVGAWKQCSDSTRDEAKKIAKMRYSWFIMMAYKYSKAAFILSILEIKSPDSEKFLHEPLIDNFKKMPTDYYTPLIQDNAASSENMELYYKKLFELYGQNIDVLIKSTEMNVPLNFKLHETSGSHGKKHKKDVWIPEKTNFNETDYMKIIMNDAISAYKNISEIILEDNSTDFVECMKLRCSLLDNGKHIKEDKWNKLTKELLNGFEKEKAILKDVANTGGDKYKNFHIKIDADIEYKNQQDKSPDKSAKNHVFGYETVVVTFIIPNTAEIYKKHIPRVSNHGAVTRDNEGNLQIYMKKINGKWYWNPFGW